MRTAITDFDELRIVCSMELSAKNRRKPGFRAALTTTGANPAATRRLLPAKSGGKLAAAGAEC
jgi:hypothetical protein